MSEGDKQLAQGLTLRAVELGGSDSLGGDVRVELAERTTVLVGKNGAGKSALLERISAGFGVMWGFASQTDPGRFACELDFQDARRLRYECVWLPENSLDDAVGTVVARLEETCTLTDPVPRELWRIHDRALIRGGAGYFAMMGGGYRSLKYGDLLYHLSCSIRRMGGGVPKGPGEREEIVFSAVSGSRPPTSNPLAMLALRLVQMQQTQAAEFDELIEIGRRTQIFHDIEIGRYLDARHPGQGREFTSVAVDGINLGLLSDGTLRAIQIFMELLNPGTAILLIDEPESAAHPGLLARLLSEIEAYSLDRKIVLATQSPQVVNWALPEAIRLVERSAGATSVRSLDEATLKRLERYLHDDDSLGDFIYGGGIDGFAE